MQLPCSKLFLLRCINSMFNVQLHVQFIFYNFYFVNILILKIQKIDYFRNFLIMMLISHSTNANRRFFVVIHISISVPVSNFSSIYSFPNHLAIFISSKIRKAAIFKNGAYLVFYKCYRWGFFFW